MEIIESGYVPIGMGKAVKYTLSKTSALDLMIKDEEQAGPAYDALVDDLASKADTPCKAKFIRLLLGEHKKDEQKHHDALVKLKEMM